MNILITKADGTVEPFKIEKLRRSLKRSGADDSIIPTVLDQVSVELHEGIHTQEIYRRAFSLLRKYEHTAAARYSLRRALFGLGPTGFPFEEFLGKLFQADGYSTSIGDTIVGTCATHEIDVSAYKKDHSFVAEAKFHSRPGIKSDLQVAMYSYARFLDIKDKAICSDDVCGIKEFWVITNTKFTTTAEQYAECVGLPLLSWSYPKGNNLHDRIQKAKIYPITVLTELSASQAVILLEAGVLLCKELLNQQQVLKRLHLSEAKQRAILKETRELVQ